MSSGFGLGFGTMGCCGYTMLAVDEKNITRPI